MKLLYGPMITTGALNDSFIGGTEPFPVYLAIRVVLAIFVLISTHWPWRVTGWRESRFHAGNWKSVARKKPDYIHVSSA